MKNKTLRNTVSFQYLSQTYYKIPGNRYCITKCLHINNFNFFIFDFIYVLHFHMEVHKRY
jgi:hypothetical protein